MLTEQRLQDLYVDMLASYPQGISSTSTKKFDATREYLSTELGIPEDGIYITGSGTRAGNLEVRLSQGQQAKQHTVLGVTYLLDDVGTKENISKLTSSAFTTAEKYVGASGKAEYDVILIVVISGPNLNVTGIMYLATSPVAASIISAIPGIATRPIATSASTLSSFPAYVTGCTSSCIQKIYFGAPGAGKSYKVNEVTAGGIVIRTTFHPDCDYSTFVGSYKPVVLDDGRLTYLFIKQAFLKAYLMAWKFLTSPPPASSAGLLTFVVKGATYSIKSIKLNQLTQTKDIDLPKKNVWNVWKDLWKSGTFSIPTGRQSGRSIEQAISAYIIQNCLPEGATVEDFDTGWDNLIARLKEGPVEAQSGPGGKVYTISESEKKDCVHVQTDANNSKDRLEECYDDPEKCNGVETGIVDILKKINEDSFDEAWQGLEKMVGATPQTNGNNDTFVAPRPIYLVIEEINRGNCAQIFGDVFQLLDRQESGFSTYPIEADSEIQTAIEKAFRDEDEFKLSRDIDVDYVVDNYTSAFGASLSEDITKGRVLLLPPNLNILATMNTSDQSLFPMDSAFKRRWDWEYVPIDSANPKSQFKITIGDKTYKWASFLDEANKRIHKLSDSEDKQMGNFFIKSDVGVEEFKSKVMFYLWSEVCKEYENAGSFFKDKRNGDAEFTFNSLFPTNDATNGILQGFMEFLGVEEA